MLDTGITDLSAIEVQVVESPQPLEVLQTGTRDRSVEELQAAEFRQALDVLQTGVADFPAVKMQRSELRQRSKALPFLIRDIPAGGLWFAQRRANYRTARALLVEYDLAAEFANLGNDLVLIRTRFCGVRHCCTRRRDVHEQNQQAAVSHGMILSAWRRRELCVPLSRERQDA
jgi:hypothetical protein